MAASRDCELTGNGRKYAFDLVAQGDQDRDGDHGNESENQGVLHESLALLALHPAQRALGASDNCVDHNFFTTFHDKSVSWGKFWYAALIHLSVCALGK